MSRSFIEIKVTLIDVSYWHQELLLETWHKEDGILNGTHFHIKNLSNPTQNIIANRKLVQKQIFELSETTSER